MDFKMAKLKEIDLEKVKVRSEQLKILIPF
jgi:hypothetical protein